MLFNWPIRPELIPALADIPAGYKFGTTRTTTATPHKHAGLDMGALGYDVLAAQNGKVERAYAYDKLGGPGIIDITHDDDSGFSWKTRYLHLDPKSFVVKAGDTVMSGLPIAKVGLLTSGSHLHFEIRQCSLGYTCTWPSGWTAVDPLTMLSGGAGVGPGADQGQLALLIAIGAALYFMVRG